MIITKFIAVAFGAAILIPLSATGSTVNPDSDIASGGVYNIFTPHFYAEAFKTEDGAGAREFTFVNDDPLSVTLLLTTATVNALAAMFKGGVTFAWLESGNSIHVGAQKRYFSGELDTMIAGGGIDTLRISFGDPKTRVGFPDGGIAHFSIETVAAPSPVPLPAGGLLLLGALGGIAALRRRANGV